MLDALADLAQVAPRAAAPALDAMAYLNLVYSMMSSILSDRNFTYSGTRVPPADAAGYRIAIPAPPPGESAIGDLVLTTPTGARIGVDIAASPVMAPGAVTRAVSVLQRGDAVGYLFIARGRVPSSIERTASVLPGPAAIVGVQGAEDRERLADAVSRLVSAADEADRGS